MVDFRRMIPVLAVIAFLLGSAVTASAQPNAPFQCFANGGVSTPARSEDITALVGDLVLNCLGGTATAFGAPIPQVNVQIFLNTSLTSRLMTTSTTATQWSEAVLILDEPLPGAQFGCVPAAGALGCPGIGNGAGAPIYYGSGTAGTLGNNKNVFQGIQTTSNSVTFIGVP